MSNTLSALITAIRLEADDVISIELSPPRGGVFPQFHAGAHIGLILSNGMVRHYSLLNSPDDTGRYVLGVLYDRTSRGGSRYIHRQLRVGMTVPITPPRNNFNLHEDAAHSVLVAGGIGITPILSMIRRLKALGKSQELLYLARSRRLAPFLGHIEDLKVRATWHFDDEKGARPDLRALLVERSHTTGTHYYACGPTSMIDAFERACEALGYTHVHVERFASANIETAPQTKATYVAELSRSGRTFTITPERSLLDTLLDAGVDVNFSCREGVCGTCETRVISGTPDHRDSVLSASERTSNKTMIVCVSGSQSDRLVLEL